MTSHTNRLNHLPFIYGPQHDYGQDDRNFYADHPGTTLINTFTAKKGDQANLQIAALGFYECEINDQKISLSVLNGHWTDYTKRVYYETYDISDLLVDGVNIIAVELGNGYYNPSPLRYFGKYNLRERLTEVGDPRIALSLTVNDQVVLVSDESWKVRENHTLFNNIFLGEKVDFAHEYNKISDVLLDHTERNLAENRMEPIMEKGHVKPVSIVRDDKENLIVDFGETITGFIEIEWNAQAGQEVFLKFAEVAYPDGRLDFKPNANGSVGEIRPDGKRVDGGPGAPENAVQLDTLISAEGENYFKNKFSWHSFRYCQIENLDEKDLIRIEGIYVHTDVEETGKIEMEHPFLTDLYDAALRTKLNNLHSSFEDCARERLGYGGDMMTLADSNLYAFNVKNVYEKVIQDFIDDQTEAGGFPETAPYMGIQSQGTANGEGPMLWQYAPMYIAGKLLQFYTDVDYVEKQYPYFKKNVDYFLSWDPAELAKHDLGDHGSILIMGQFYKPTPDKILAGWCTQILFLDTLVYISKMLKKDPASYALYEKVADELRHQTVELFRHEDGTYGEGTQTGIAFAAMAGLEDRHELAEKLAAKIEADHGVINAGIFGTKFAYDLLHEIGRDDLIEHWLTQDSDISFVKMLSNGNKALAELFAGESYSYNHAMFSSFVQWYYQGLAGISAAPDALGFDHVILAPYFSRNMDSVNAEVGTIHGLICSKWERKDGKIFWHVEIPEGITYQIERVPADTTIEIQVVSAKKRDLGT